MKIKNEPMAWGVFFALWFLLSVLIAVQTGCASVPGRGGAERDAMTVEVRVLCHNGASGHIGVGSGVIISDRHVLTAYHVVSGCTDEAVIGIQLEDATIFRVWYERAWPALDVARLRIDGKLARNDPIRFARPRRDSEVCTSVAAPTRTSHCGRVTDTYTPRIDRDQGFTHGFAMTAFTTPGNSGGGVYDRDGALVGIVTGVSKRQSPRYTGGLAVPVWGIRHEVLR